MQIDGAKARMRQYLFRHKLPIGTGDDQVCIHLHDLCVIALDVLRLKQHQPFGERILLDGRHRQQLLSAAFAIGLCDDEHDVVIRFCQPLQHRAGDRRGPHKNDLFFLHVLTSDFFRYYTLIPAVL